LLAAVFMLDRMGYYQKGEVFEVNVTSGSVRSIKSGLWAADGLWIDERYSMLYVGELFSSKLWAYDLIARKDRGNHYHTLSYHTTIHTHT
jgi:sugar lactone lactonase YvrE